MVVELGFINVNIGCVYLKCETIIHTPIMHVIILDKISVYSVTKYNKCHYGLLALNVIKAYDVNV